MDVASHKLLLRTILNINMAEIRAERSEKNVRSKTNAQSGDGKKNNQADWLKMDHQGCTTDILD